MASRNNALGTYTMLEAGASPVYIYDLNRLEQQGIGDISHLPYSFKVLLESMLRQVDGTSVKEEDIVQFLTPSPIGERYEIPFKPARIILQDSSGVPVLVDFASMRDELSRHGVDPATVNPAIPVDLIIDHSLQVDFYGSENAAKKNLEMEYKRNRERYEFLRWAQRSFRNLRVFPPGVGIIHQVNLEYLSPVVQIREQHGDRIIFPDSVLGTDSHTTMINSLGVLGWGVGGIEAESVMLGYPVSMLVPPVVGVQLVGEMPEYVTSTDVALTITNKLRTSNVVGKFIEFFGPGMAHLSLADRATIANMAPEYGATLSYFPIDAETLNFLRMTGKPNGVVERVERYAKSQGLFYTPDSVPRYTEIITIHLSEMEPTVAGPKRPQDSMPLGDIQKSFQMNLQEEKTAEKISVSSKPERHSLTHGSIVLAAITSCTNTSNPVSMIGAGLLAKKAVEKGLTVPSTIKTSMAPGSQVVTEYLEAAGLLPYLEKLNFYNVGYGCTTCVGNGGSLDPGIEEEIQTSNLYVASVLSGNRNFEGRIHPLVKHNYLASPMLVIAFALAGTVNTNLNNDPLGCDPSGKPVYLKDIWPKRDEILDVAGRVIKPDIYKSVYGNSESDAMWEQLDVEFGELYKWKPGSTYFLKAPFFASGSAAAGNTSGSAVQGARALLALGDSITTDHISPVGRIHKDSPAGRYLQQKEIEPDDFNTYGARRGNHEVLIRGTFANSRLHNSLVEKTGWYTKHFPSAQIESIYDAAARYRMEGVPLIILAGKEYGTGSARDWAAKGTRLMGIKAVIAESFERIHRSNLVFMGVLPLQFMPDEGWKSLGLTGEETYTFEIPPLLEPLHKIPVIARSPKGAYRFYVTVRLDSRTEIDYYFQGGILNKVFSQLKKNTV
jgi:aconitate hydratase